MAEIGTHDIAAKSNQEKHLHSSSVNVIFRDGLLLIISYLTLDEVATSFIGVNQHWCNIAASEPSRRLTLTLHEFSPSIPKFSPLARHITCAKVSDVHTITRFNETMVSLQALEEYHATLRDEPRPAAAVGSPPSALARLINRVNPFKKKPLPPPPQPIIPIHIGSKIKSLHLKLVSDDPHARQHHSGQYVTLDAVHICQLFLGMARCASLESLHLDWLPYPGYFDYSLIGKLTQLRSLSLDMMDKPESIRAFIVAVREIPNLTQLDVGDPRKMLRHMIEMDVKFPKIKKLSVDSVDFTVHRILPWVVTILPSLTEFHPHHYNIDDLLTAAKFTNLQSMILKERPALVMSGMALETDENTIDALVQCRSLTHLTFEHWRFTSEAHWRRLFAGCRNLMSLGFGDAHELRRTADAVQFDLLSQLIPVALRLQKLTLHHTHLPVSTVQHLVHFASLTHLILRREAFIPRVTINEEVDRRIRPYPIPPRISFDHLYEFFDSPAVLPQLQYLKIEMLPEPKLRTQKQQMEDQLEQLLQFHQRPEPGPRIFIFDLSDRRGRAFSLFRKYDRSQAEMAATAVVEPRYAIDLNLGPPDMTSPAASLFTSGLHLIFSFLSPRDWFSSTSTCRSWHATLSSQPCLRFEHGTNTTIEMLARLLRITVTPQFKLVGSQLHLARSHFPEFVDEKKALQSNLLISATSFSPPILRHIACINLTGKTWYRSISVAQQHALFSRLPQLEFVIFNFYLRVDDMWWSQRERLPEIKPTDERQEWAELNKLKKNFFGPCSRHLKLLSCTFIQPRFSDHFLPEELVSSETFFSVKELLSHVSQCSTLRLLELVSLPLAVDLAPLLTTPPASLTTLKLLGYAEEMSSALAQEWVTHAQAHFVQHLRCIASAASSLTSLQLNESYRLNALQQLFFEHASTNHIVFSHLHYLTIGSTSLPTESSELSTLSSIMPNLKKLAVATRMGQVTENELVALTKFKQLEILKLVKLPDEREVIDEKEEKEEDKRRVDTSAIISSLGSLHHLTHLGFVSWSLSTSEEWERLFTCVKKLDSLSLAVRPEQNEYLLRDLTSSLTVCQRLQHLSLINTQLPLSQLQLLCRLTSLKHLSLSSYSFVADKATVEEDHPHSTTSQAMNVCYQTLNDATFLPHLDKLEMPVTSTHLGHNLDTRPDLFVRFEDERQFVYDRTSRINVGKFRVPITAVTQ